jgi:N-acetylglucosamine kinase-like BadF-type ATPase
MTILLVGVDGGGSHTEAVVADQALTIRARARGGGSAIGPGRVAPGARAIVATVRQALQDIGTADVPEVLVAGVAGVGRDEERVALLQALLDAGLARRVEVTTDAAIALESVFPLSPGILLNAGSGSIAYARDPAGIVWRAGGLGWQLGDEGSGYALGRAALGLVGRAADGRGPSTTLSQSIPARVGADSLDGLVRWAGSATPTNVAALAQAVQEAARDGDGPAAALVAEAAQALADHVLVLLRRFPAHTPVSLALAGGILTAGWPVRTMLEKLLADRAPQVSVLAQPVDPPRGALAMAARLRG